MASLQQHVGLLLNNASSHRRSPPSSALLLGRSGTPCSCEMHVEETGNACHSSAALYPMGDNGRRAERQGCAWGRVPHQHMAPLSGQEAAFPAMSPSSSTLWDSAPAFLLQTHTGKVKLGERCGRQTINKRYRKQLQARRSVHVVSCVSVNGVGPCCFILKVRVPVVSCLVFISPSTMITFM